MIGKLLLFVLLVFPWTLRAQIDSLRPIHISKFEKFLDNVSESKAYRMTYIGVPLVMGGLIVKSEDDHFRSLRNDYLPTFKQGYDDKFQYAPAVLMLGLKIGGVPSRSSWGRMLVSDAFSTVLMVAVVNQLKSRAGVLRPDGSSHNSFPSGHTATAFMTAMMLSKEYGGENPWYSIAGFTISTVTGLTRMANNRHWLSDVLAGAGFGILSTETGYFLADLIFRDKGIRYYDDDDTFDRLHKPSFFGVSLGLNKIPGSYRLENGSKIAFSSGGTAGLEGTGFLTPYFGLGARLSASTVSFTYNNVAEEKTLDVWSLFPGTYFSYPLSSRFALGGKAALGFSYFPKCKLSDMTIGKKGGLGVAAGTSFSFSANQNLGVKFFMDYNLQPTPAAMNRNFIQVITMGSQVSVLF